MVKLIGPCMSLDARGQLGKALIFAKNGKTNYSKSYAVPANPRSAAQTVQRLAVRGITQGWGWAKIWNALGYPPFPQQDELGAYHAYLKFNLQNWRSGLPPLPLYRPYQDYAEPFESANYTKNGRFHTITIEQAYDEPTPFAYQYTASTTPGGSTEKADTIRLFAFTENPLGAYNDSFVWEAPTDATYIFMVRRSNVMGELCQWEEITEAP